MLSRLLISVFIVFVFSAGLSAQSSSTQKNPIHYRLLMTSINIEDVQPDEISISLNAFNTGRESVDLSEFNSVPKEMEIKFEESFHRSSLSHLEDEIRSGLINKNIVIPNGKILRNIRFSLPANESLYKQLTKNQKRFSKAYTPKKKNNKAAELKYKTSNKKLNPAPNFIAKNKKKKSKEKLNENKSKVDKVATTIDSDNPSAINKSTPNNSTVKRKTKAEFELERKEKEMADAKMKANERKELEIKNKEMEALKIKEKEMAEEKIASENDAPKKNERLSIIERQKLKRKEREEAKANEYKIDKATQKEDEKAILESLGVGNSKSKSKSEGGVAFDTKASVEASKNSYDEKAVCPDLILNSINIVKKSKNWVTIEYTLTNQGKGPANLGKDKNGQGIALRAFLSSSEKISRGALPLGGGFIDYGKEGQLDPNNSHKGTLKLDIRKMTRFTPYVIINLDPFNVIEECDKTNNYGNVKIGG